MKPMLFGSASLHFRLQGGVRIRTGVRRHSRLKLVERTLLLPVFLTSIRNVSTTSLLNGIQAVALRRPPGP
jgi:hypothetical protein